MKVIASDMAKVIYCQNQTQSSENIHFGCMDQDFSILSLYPLHWLKIKFNFTSSCRGDPFLRQFTRHSFIFIGTKSVKFVQNCTEFLQV